MSSTLRDAQAPSHRECLLPSAARAPSVTQVPPAKKITFLKRGDPRFAGVRLAVHQRAFRSFGALMDELSQRVPLSFGVRSVTTPRGLHGLSALEQLQDGGCYLCSDKRPPTTPSGPCWPRGRSPSASHSQNFEGRCEGPGTPSSCKSLKTPRRIMLVKNGDPRVQQTMVLSPRNMRNLTAFLSRASDLLHFPVKQVYTTSGRKVDTLKALLRSPSVLVCASHEPFRTLAMEDVRRNGMETLSGQILRNKNGSWGPKAKQSVIHERSRPASRPRQFSLLSERSGLSDPSVSLPPDCMDPVPDRHPQDMPVHLGPLVAGDDFEKNVRVNEDGSLSVEMKVRFHLLGEDPVLWSRRVRATSTLSVAGGEHPVLGEAEPLGRVWKGHSGDPSEPGAQGLGSCQAGGVGAFDRGRWQQGSGYEIWMNPLFTSQGERAASPRRSGQTHHSCSRVPRSQGATIRKRRSRDSVSPASSDRPPEGSEPNSSCCSRSLEDDIGNYGPHLASRAGEGAGQGATTCGREHYHCLNPGACGLADAPPDTWMSAGSHEESSERGEPPQASPSKSSRATTSWGATQPGGPGSLTLTVSPSSLRNEDAEAEESGPDTQDRSGSGVSLSLSPGRASSGDRAGSRSPASARASTLGRSRKQEGRAGALSSPSISGLSQRAQRGRPKQRHHPKDPPCPLDSPVSRPVPRPPSRARACPEGPAPGLSGSPSSARKPGSWFSASLHSQDTRGLSSIAITPVSNSDSAPNLYSPNSPSAETEGGPGFQACSPAPTPSNTSGSFNSHTEQAKGDSPKPPWPLVLPVERPEGGRLGSHRGSCCSQLSTWSLAHRSPGKTQVLPASQPGGRQGPSSGACLACSRFCPMPPMPRPSGKRHPPRYRGQSKGNPSAAGGVGGEEEGEEKLDVCHSQAPSSQEGPSGEAVRAVRRGSPCRGLRLRKFQGQDAGGGEGLEEQAEDGGMTLGALPRASPEAVVRAWLSNIPEEPMKYEMVDEGEDVAGLDPEGPEGDPVSTRSPDDLESSIQARQPSLEKATSEKAEPDGVRPVPGSASPTSGAGLPGSKVSEAPPEAETGKGAAVDHGMGQGRLPSTISASVQIVKVLKGSEQGRPSSLPEVSSSEGRRLGRSALALITCLARLHFFDDDLGSSTGKVRFLDSPRYQELLSTFQALWPGSGLGHRDLVSGLQELGWCQALRDLRSHAATEDFTPTSSSGVDVGSGSGGSGEGSGPCAVDCALVPERVELPLNVSCQRPDSGASVNPEVPGNHQPSGSEAGDTSEDGAERNSGEQTLGSDLGGGAENVMKEGGVQLEEIEEKERAELQEEAAKGGAEEGGSVGRELPGAGSQNGAGAQEDAILQEKEAEGLVSATLSPPGRRGSPTEPPRSLSERNSDASGSQSGPKAEPALEKLPRAAETGGGQTQAKLHQGAGERGTSTARRGSLGPDPLWVSRLLKKMEKAFLDHLASATAELRARWGLQSNDLLDQMVAELQQDMGRRLQDSTERELHKIQSWAGGTALGPPREALRWEASLQTEQRRWRLRGLHNLSAFSEQMQGWGPLSFSLEDVPTFQGALGTQLGEEAEGEEFCPCEACMRKKAVPVSPRDAVAASSAPIREAFDLQQILQKRKAGCADGGRAEVAPAKRGMEPLRRDPSGMDTVQGSGQGPGAEEGDKGEGSQTLGRDEGARKAEEAATQEREGKTEPCVGSDLERGVGKEEENTDRGSGAEDTQEDKASGGSDHGPGEQDADACTSEAQEAEGEEEPESEGNQREREGGARAGQSGEASGNSSPDPEGRPVPSPAPEADTPCQRSGPKSGPSSCSTSSLETCSQLSQKGSEDESSSRHTRNMEDESKDIPDPEKKVTGVHTESSTSEQEGTPLGLRTQEIETEEDQAPEQEEEEDQAPEQEEEEDQAPEQEAEEDQAPEQGAEEDQAPEQEAEEDQAPEQGAEEDQAPEQEAEEDQAPEQEEEEDQAPEQEEEEDQAPEQEEEEDQAPEQGAEEDQAPEQEEEEDQAPEQEEEGNQAPEQGAEEDQAPEQEEEEDQAPEQEEEEDQAPEQGAEEDQAPEQEEEEDQAPEQEEEEDQAPEQGAEEDQAPEQEEEEDQAPEQEAEEDQAPEQEEEEDQAPEQEEEESQAPEQEAEEDQAPEQEAEEDQAPEQEEEKSQAPEQEAEGNQAPEQGAEEDQAPEQEAEEDQAPEQEEEESQAPEQEAEGNQAPEQGAEEDQAPEQEAEEDQAPEQEEEEDQAPEQEEEEDQAPEQEEEEDQAPEQGAEEGSDLEAKKVVQSLTSTETSFKPPPKDRTDGFGQDDLDF